MTPPTIRASARTMSTVRLLAACRKVVAAVTKVIWNSEVPITTAVGMPIR